MADAAPNSVDFGILNKPIVQSPSDAPQSSTDPFDTPSSVITPYLVMSGERLANDPAFITEAGITHVLNLTQAPSNPDVIALARCHTIPLADTTSQELLPILPEAVAFIGELGLFLAAVLANSGR